MKEKSYSEALGWMLEAAKGWRHLNPDVVPKIQFNFPPGVVLIATISDAINHHYVSVDEHGKKLISCMCAPFPRWREPSVLMVRAVIEAAFA